MREGQKLVDDSLSNCAKERSDAGNRAMFECETYNSSDISGNADSAEGLRNRGLKPGSHIAPDGTEYSGMAFEVEAVSSPYVLCRFLGNDDLIVRFDVRHTQLILLEDDYVDSLVAIYDEAEQRAKKVLDEFNAALVSAAEEYGEKITCQFGDCATPTAKATRKKPTPKKKSVKS